MRTLRFAWVPSSSKLIVPRMLGSDPSSTMVKTSLATFCPIFPVKAPISRATAVAEVQPQARRVGPGQDVSGLGVASYQVWMQAYPAEVGRCGRGLEAYFDDSPFEDLANWVLAAEGDCGKPVTFLGLVTLPQLGFLAFAAMAGVALRMNWFPLRRETHR